MYVFPQGVGYIFAYWAFHYTIFLSSIEVQILPMYMKNVNYFKQKKKLLNVQHGFTLAQYCHMINFQW